MNELQQDRTLGLLNAIEENSQASQRELAKHTGVALGLVNSYIKRCVKKGWIKISDAPANRYLYYLTPQGFIEKARLSARYLSDSFAFYRQAAASCEDLLDFLVLHNKKRIVIAGASNLAEIFILKSLEKELSIIAVYDPNYIGKRFLTTPVSNIWHIDDEIDAVVLCAIDQPNKIYNNLVQKVKVEDVHVPDILVRWFGCKL